MSRGPVYSMASNFVAANEGGAAAAGIEQAGGDALELAQGDDHFELRRKQDNGLAAMLGGDQLMMSKRRHKRRTGPLPWHLPPTGAGALPYSGSVSGPCYDVSGANLYKCINEQPQPIPDTNYIGFVGNCTVDVTIDASLVGPPAPVAPHLYTGWKLNFQWWQPVGSPGMTLQADLYDDDPNTGSLIVSTGPLTGQQINPLQGNVSLQLTPAQALAAEGSLFTPLGIRFTSVGAISQGLALLWAELLMPHA